MKKVFRMPSSAESTGDAVPMYHDGTYHIFSLTPAPGTTVYPPRLRTTWSHTVSKDLIHWEDLPTALYPSDRAGDPDTSGIWTGCALYGEGQYHIFYTGYALENEYQQTICHATSPDGIQWEKDAANPVVSPKVDEYEPLDWRDPYVFYNEEDRQWWMLLSARKNQGPPTRRGCVVLYRSEDLVRWTYYGPLYVPYHTNCPECAEMWKEGNLWYLSYSRFSEWGDTIYRVSESPFGPWRTPKMTGIGGRRFYAAKSLQNDEGRRLYFAWAHDRANRSDTGEWYWGGAFCVPHEVIPSPEGEISVKMPREILQIYPRSGDVRYTSMLGDGSQQGHTVRLNSLQTLSYGFLAVEGNRFLFRCKAKPNLAYDHFGIVLKSDKNLSRYLLLQIEVGMQRVSLLDMPQDVDPFWQQSCQSVLEPKASGPDGPRVSEKPFHFQDGDEIDIKVLVEDDMVEIFVGEKVALTFRSYAQSDYALGLLAQDADVTFSDIEIAYPEE